MVDLRILLTVVAPLAVTALTLVLWGVLVIIQSPRPSWRDSLNHSIAGLLFTLAVLVLLVAGEEAGLIAVGAWGTRVVNGVAGFFALIGLPRTAAELRAALRRHPEG
jgi:hypothetical protein